MTKKTIVRVMVAIAILLGMQQTAADAQILKKVTGAVKRGVRSGINDQANKLEGEVQNTVNQTIDNAVRPVSEEAGVDPATGELTATPAEPVADPFDEEAKLKAKVHWWCEDKENPCYQALHWTGNRTSEYVKQVEALYDELNNLWQQKGWFFGTATMNHWVGVEGDQNIPADEMARYAFTKNFVDNPTFQNFQYFCLVLPFQNARFHGCFQYYFDDPSTGIVQREPQRIILYHWPNKIVMQDERTAREQYAISIARKTFTLEELCNYAMKLLQGARDQYAKGSVRDTDLHRIFQVFALDDEIIRKHKDYSETESHVLALHRAMNDPKLLTGRPYVGQYFDIFFAYRDAKMPKTDMPYNVTVDATTKKNGISAAQSFASEKGEEYVDVVFRGNSWTAYKNPNYPYEVTHHSLPISVVTKRSGIYVLYNGSLQRDTSNRYRVAIAMDDTASGVPVNYVKK